MSSSVTVSAPGKILLAGGYLVLERPNVGLVLAADKRFFTTVRPLHGVIQGTILVKSPQFHAQWEYHYNADGLCASPANASTNDFVEKTLRVVLLLLQPPPDTLALEIIIQADNDFYSVLPHLHDSKSPQAVRQLDRFLKCPTDAHGKAIVHKTGLGSSAALTTSLVGAWLQQHRLYSNCSLSLSFYQMLP